MNPTLTQYSHSSFFSRTTPKALLGMSLWTPYQCSYGRREFCRYANHTMNSFYQLHRLDDFKKQLKDNKIKKLGDLALDNDNTKGFTEKLIDDAKPYDEPDERFPDHFFDRGYTYSCNCEGCLKLCGVETDVFLKSVANTTLGEIWGNSANDLIFQPIWAEVADRAYKTIVAIDKFSSQYGYIHAANIPTDVGNSHGYAESMALITSAIDKGDTKPQITTNDIGWQIQSEGQSLFMETPLRILGMFRGPAKEDKTDSNGFLGGMEPYMIIESTKEVFDSMKNAMIVLANTCTFVQKQSDPENWFLLCESE